MFYSGLIWKYKVNRPLSEDERILRLKQDERLAVEPADEAALIKVNSTYLESLDKYFMEKGWLTLVGWLAILICVGGMLLVSYGFLSAIDGPYKGREQVVYYSVAGVVAMFSLPIPICIIMLKYEMWRLTHYPIRLNRKNRMLYVFRQDRSVLSVPWDEVFFTLNKENSRPMANLWEIQGHVLNKDGSTVEETFAFSDVADHDVLRRHWEFLRRYMEEGPERLVDGVRGYAPVDRRKESFGEGFARLVADDVVLSPLVAIIFSPFTFLQACARWVAMRTCTIPVWPAEIEAACAVDPRDPWARDAQCRG